VYPSKHEEVFIIKTILLSEKISRKDQYELKEITKGYKIPLVSSTMFEVMLNNESRKKYVSYFLSLITHKNMDYIMKNIMFSKAELDKDNYHQSKKTVDLVCKIDDDIYNIELNNNTTIESLERNIAYAIDLYKSKMYRGSKYDYRKTLQINICNFSFEGHEKTMDNFYLRNEEGKILTEKVQIIYIYLPKIRRKYYNKNELTELEKLLIVFNEQETKELKKIMEGNKIMEEYHKEAKEASIEERVIGLYDKELYDEMMEYHKLRHAKEDGLEEGISKGEQRKSLEIAKNLLKKGIDIITVGEVTGLAIEQLNSL